MTNQTSNSQDSTDTKSTKPMDEATKVSSNKGGCGCGGH